MRLDSEQRKIVGAIKAESRRIRDPRARKVFLKAAVETGLVESGIRNLPGGDADSAGWRQERASLYKNPTNVSASVRRFREEFEQFYKPGAKSYDVAAQVQRPAAQYRGRYHDVAGQASQLLGQGGGGGSSPSSAGSPSSSTSYRPGVDNSQVRQQAMLSYIDQRNNPNALLELKTALDSAQDTPGKYTYSTKPAKGGGSHGVIRKGKSPLLELFWQGAGGIDVKNGKKVPQGFVEGHRDHVHVAAGPKTVVALGQLAEKMGLHVGENPKYGGVHPVHVKGSYHYKGEAIDVSGDPGKMRAYAHAVAKLYGLA